jgi:hypothetical protein
MIHYTSHPKIIKFTRIFLLILIILGIGLLVTQKHWVPKLVDQIMAYEKLPEIVVAHNNQKVFFKLKEFNVPFGDERYDDRQIIQREANGNEVILVESVKKALPELQNMTLATLSFPPNSDKLYLVAVIYASDAPPGKVYQFNVSTKKFLELPIITKYYADYGQKSISPDGKRVVTMENPDNRSDKQKLFLLNLEQDTVQVLVSLTGKEGITFCSPQSECWGNSGSLTWRDNQTVEYGVYDLGHLVVSEFGMDYPLIETRMIKTN